MFIVQQLFILSRERKKEKQRSSTVKAEGISIATCISLQQYLQAQDTRIASL